MAAVNTELWGEKSTFDRSRNDHDQKQISIALENFTYRILTPVSPLVLIFFCLFFVSLYAADETAHRSGQFWTSSINWKVASRSLRPSAILWSVSQITWIERVFWLVDSNQNTFSNRSHVKYEFTNTKKLVKKLARIEASSICRQQFANVFADCFCAVHTHQLEFANTSLPT